MTPPSKKPRTQKASGSKSAEYKVTLTALIDGAQHDALRTLSFMRGTSLADLVREALAMYLEKNGPTQAEMDDIFRRLRAAAKVGRARTR
ncbi:MAG: hypothetical protein ACYTG2_15455 [Planctomycetota bacterium]|jgi:hypothetical protein